ncbi:unnamed protein product [Cyclocybe aegerita]|uniref:Uncharacterized protein n=1 Tax=Cyclocybe aegerita TaxID=1973307 RepID=A0A8S0WHM8_CYCAE|nr:unnamed protein product [Cyclocybe aegerita]
MSRPSATRSNARWGWWRAYFIDCPLSQADPIFHLFGKSGAKSTKSGKTKCYCKACYEVEIEQCCQAEAEQLRLGFVAAARMKDELSKQIYRFRRHATINYDEELALYEFLELDADGEEDPELDGVAEEVLAN